MQNQEDQVKEFIHSVTPVFNYSKFKIKRLKKFDGKPLTEDLMEELKNCLMNAVEYNQTKEVK